MNEILAALAYKLAIHILRASAEPFKLTRFGQGSSSNS